MFRISCGSEILKEREELSKRDEKERVFADMFEKESENGPKGCAVKGAERGSCVVRQITVQTSSHKFS